MKKIILIPDSFKGSISSRKFCEIAEKEIRTKLPESEIISLPIADGGEGTIDSLNSVVGGNIIKVKTVNSLYENTQAEILRLDGKTYFIETAQAAGLPQIKGRENPEITTTYGMGKLIEYAADCGAEEIILALGGSSTNDCGAGLLSYLGVDFYDKNGKTFIPAGGTLKNVTKIKFNRKFNRYKKIKFKAMCDVTNPLYGENGCSHIFAPQKGADEKTVLRLEDGVKLFAEVCKKTLKKSFSSVSGAGAAGGLGFCCKAFLNAELVSGIDTLLSLFNFDKIVKGADMIITGEGCFDYQSLMGKTIGGIIRRSANVPVYVLCGKYKPFDYDKFNNIKSVIPISGNQDLKTALINAEENLKKAVQNMF